jgi:molybdopterin converting factor small subunit
MNVRIQMFARARDLAGGEIVELSLSEGATIGALRGKLAAEVPALSPILPHCMFAIDAEYAGDETPIAAGAKIAGIPPVSGG